MLAVLLLLACRSDGGVVAFDDPDSFCDDETVAAAAVGTTPIAGCHDTVTVDPVADPWRVRVLWDWIPPSGAGGSEVTVAWLGDASAPAVLAGTPDGKMVALDGATGTERWWEEGFGITSAAAAVRDATDGELRIVVDHDGATASLAALDEGGDRLWTGASPHGAGLVVVADPDRDGQAEALVDYAFLDLATGVPDWQTARSVGAAIVADADLDGTPSVFSRCREQDAFTGAIVREFDKDCSGGSSWAASLQADGDEEAEILWTYAGFALYEHDGAPLWSLPLGGVSWGAPCAGDLDGDGASEVAAPGDDVVVAVELDGTILWSMPTEQPSRGHGCAAFDLDADGAMEVLVSESEAFVIYDGRTGAVRFRDGRRSTDFDVSYPVVADIDVDGHAEIIVSGALDGTALRAYAHDGEGWAPAGPTWGLYDYAVTNIAGDGTIPRVPEPSWLHYNLMRARPVADDIPLADLRVEPVERCPTGAGHDEARLLVRVINQGVAWAPAGAYVVAFSGDHEIGRAALPALEPGTILSPVEIPLADGAEAPTAVVVDDGSDVHECDEGNNTADVALAR